MENNTRVLATVGGQAITEADVDAAVSQRRTFVGKVMSLLFICRLNWS